MRAEIGKAIFVLVVFFNHTLSKLVKEIVVRVGNNGHKWSGRLEPVGFADWTVSCEKCGTKYYNGNKIKCNEAKFNNLLK